MTHTIELLLAHRSIRTFTDEEIPVEDVSKAVACGQQAATSSFIQAYCAISVNSKPQRDRFVEITGGQQVVKDAAHFMVICGDTRRHQIIVERENLTFHSDFEGFLLATIDATLFAQNMVIAFEAMGYGTCYIGGVRNDIPAAAEVLGLPSGVYPLFGLCIGKPAQVPLSRPRLPQNAVFFEGSYPSDTEMLDFIDSYDREVENYNQRHAGKPNRWSGKIAKSFSSPRREKSAIWYQNLGATLD